MARQTESGLVRVGRVLSRSYKALLALLGLVGFILAWSGWTGPELVSRIGGVPWLDFVGSGWFRTLLVLTGFVILVLVARAWLKASPIRLTVKKFPVADKTANFTLTPRLERLDANQGVQMVGDGRVFTGLTVLWVAVENLGGDAVFTAQVRGIHPVERAEDGLRSGPRDVDEVAWEHTTSAETLIRWNKRARLKLANGSDGSQLFWFWTAESTTWTDQGDKGWKHYGIGWRLRPLEARVEFDLEVIDATHQHAETRRCFIDFGEGNRIEAFGFVDQDAVGA